MKIKKLAGITALLMASLSVVCAQTTLTTWNFDNLAIATNNSPQPSTGFGTASALGLNNPDVQSLAGSSTDPAGPKSWRIAGAGGNNWSTNAPIGTQGAKFAASTFGFYDVRILANWKSDLTWPTYKSRIQQSRQR